jgi:hypothetical protein
MQYLYDLNDPKNFIWPLELKSPDGYIGEHQHTVLFPEEPHRHFCMTDSVMHTTRPNNGLHFHEHIVGYETFFVDSGSMDIYITGKKAPIKPGSVLFIQPFQAHGMFFHEDVKYRGFFHDLPYAEGGEAAKLMRLANPDFLNDPEFPKDKAPLNDFAFREPPHNFKEVPAEECTPIRHRERPMAQFELDGATFKMLTGRWENAGLCELWCFEMKKGFYAESYKYPVNQDLFYLTEGKVKFKCYDEEFVAHKECLIKLPKFAPRSFEVLEDAVMYDVGGLPRWNDYLADRESVLALDPERAAKPETLDDMRKRFGVHYKVFGVR